MTITDPVNYFLQYILYNIYCLYKREIYKDDLKKLPKEKMTRIQENAISKWNHPKKLH